MWWEWIGEMTARVARALAGGSALLAAAASTLPRVAVSAIMAAALWGCAGDSGPAEPDWPLLTLTEEGRIDGQAAVLSTVMEVAANREGAVALVERPFQGLRFFDSSGKELDRSFPEGEGPGEFRTIRTMGWAGDSLWAYDARLRRITFISPDMELLGTVQDFTTLEPSAELEDALPVATVGLPLAILPDGSSVRWLIGFDPASPVPYPTDRSTYVFVSEEGVMETVLGTIQEGASDFSIQLSNGSAAGSFPFPMKRQFGVAPDGDLVVFAEAFQADHGTARIQVDAMEPSGQAVFSRQFPVPAIPIPASVADSAIDAGAARWERIRPEVVRVYRDRAYVPPIYPPVREVLVGRDGSIWIQGQVLSGERPYRVVDSGGTPLGRVAIPESSQVVIADEGRVWIVEVNELEIPSLVRYSVSPPR